MKSASVPRLQKIIFKIREFKIELDILVILCYTTPMKILRGQNYVKLILA